MKKFVSEFKEFALKGNVFDLAIGVIIGGAFGAITTSLINDVFMPLLGIVIGGIDLTGFTIDVVGLQGEAISIAIGNFLQAVINFLLLAFVVFLMVKFVNRFRKKEEAAPPPAPPAPGKEEILLGEIRDILKEQGKK